MNWDSLIPPGINDARVRHLWRAFCALLEGFDFRRVLMRTSSEMTAEMLPLAVWERSLEEFLFGRAWTPEVVGSLVDSSTELHALKGTLAGIRYCLSIPGISLARAITPPADPYWAPEDVEALKTWEASLPQVRLYSWRKPGRGDGFYYGDWLDDEALPGSYLELDRAPEDAGRRWTLWNPETDEEVELSGLADRLLAIPGTAPQIQLWLDADHLDDGYLTPADDEPQVIDLGGELSRELAAGAWLPTSFEPELQTSGGVSGDGPLYFGDGSLDEDFLSIDDAEWHIHRFWRVYRAEATTGTPDAYAYHDDMRFGMPPHTAELWLDLEERAGIDVNFGEPDGGFLADTDLTRLWLAAEAIGIARSARDRVLIETELARPVTFGDRRTFGSFTFGQYLPRTH